MRVYFKHYRLEQDDYNILRSLGENGPTPTTWAKHLKAGKPRSWQPAAKGGYTVCFLKDDNGNVFTGESVCSLTDTYNKTIGRGIAYSRALRNYRSLIPV